VKKKTFIILVVLLVVLVIAWTIFKKKTAILADPTPLTPGTFNPTGGSTAPVTKKPDYPFYPGEDLPMIGQLQQALNLKHNAGLSVDSIWGTKTKAALKAATGRDNANTYWDAIQILNSI